VDLCLLKKRCGKKREKGRGKSFKIISSLCGPLAIFVKLIAGYCIYNTRWVWLHNISKFVQKSRFVHVDPDQPVRHRSRHGSNV